MPTGVRRGARTLRRLAVGATALAAMVPFLAQTPARAVTNPASADAAANYLVGQMKANSFGDAGADTDCLVALAASGHQQTATLAVEKSIEGEAKAYVTNGGRAGKLAIAAAVMGDDATNYGGVNLVQTINAAVAKDPTLGGSFSAALAVIGLVRNHQPVPQALVNALVSSQDAASGAFGYQFNGFNPDPDTTAMAIEALASLPRTAPVTAAQAKAVAWAQKNMTTQGYWTSFSPANSTGLMSAALKDAGRPSAASVSWLLSQQARTKVGAWSNTLDGTSPNVMSTCQVLPAVAGASYATARYQPLATAQAGDSTGDGVADLFTIDTDGTLNFHKGSTSQALSPVGVVGTGWGDATYIGQIADPAGTGRSDLMARFSDNSLWIYQGQGMGAVNKWKRFGTGWGSMNQIVPVANLAGGSTQYVVARHTNGNLYRYQVSSTGLSNATLIGHGWGGLGAIVGIGDFTGDGRADVLGFDAKGGLWVYPGTTAATLAAGRQVGQGWNSFTTVVAPGDLSGNGTRDLVGRRTDGRLFVYDNLGGRFGAPRQIGVAASSVRLMA